MTKVVCGCKQQDIIKCCKSYIVCGQSIIGIFFFLNAIMFWVFVLFCFLFFCFVCLCTTDMLIFCLDWYFKMYFLYYLVEKILELISVLKVY